MKIIAMESRERAVMMLPSIPLSLSLPLPLSLLPLPLLLPLSLFYSLPLSSLLFKIDARPSAGLGNITYRKERRRPLNFFRSSGRFVIHPPPPQA